MNLQSLPFWIWPLNSMKQPYYQKDVNQISINDATLKLGFTSIWEQILCEELSSCNLERILLLIYMVLQLMWRKDFLCTGIIFEKLCRLLFMFLSGFTSFSGLLLFLASNLFFCSLIYSFCLLGYAFPQLEICSLH